MHCIEIKLPEEYPGVVLLAGLISFQCLIIGFTAGGKRKKLFNDNQEIESKYAGPHYAAFDKLLPKGGYPDHGNGLYSDLISYMNWYAFNIDQRKHKNYLEQITLDTFLTLVIGIVFPITALVLGSLLFLFRIVYTCVYPKSPRLWMMGTMPLFIVKTIMPIMGVVSTSVLINATPFK